MSIQNTNRIISTASIQRNLLEVAVGEKLRKKRAAAKRNWNRPKPVLCSQCEFWMDGKIAGLQKIYKRKNAPICMACILGIPRRHCARSSAGVK